MQDSKPSAPMPLQNLNLLKKSTYSKILKKFYTYSNKKVESTLLEHGPFLLPLLNNGRIHFKISKISIDNCVYTGEVNKTYARDGFGCLLHQDGSYYEGYFQKGHFHGKGRLIDKEGNLFEGFWSENIMQGEGKFIQKSPFSVLTGLFKNGLAHGQGEQVYHDDSVYKGEFLLGKKHGTGVLTLSDGTRYEGQFCRDKQCGFGVLYYTDGIRIEANWNNGRIVGVGKKIWPDGKIYEGGIVNGKCEGKGKMQWAHGKVYEGEWVDDKPHGIGMAIKKTGRRVSGSWRDGEIVVEDEDSDKDRRHRGGICEKVEDLEYKVDKACEKRVSEKREKEMRMSSHYYSTQSDEKFHSRSSSGMFDPKILIPVHWVNNKKPKRNQEFLIDDCVKIGKFLNTFEEKNVFSIFNKILKLRFRVPDFNYYEPDIIVKDGVKLEKDWMELQSGCFYRGEMLNNSPEGRGVYLTQSDIYEGYFHKGEKHGLGRQISNSHLYTGYWHRNQKSGFGTLTKKSSVYSGEFVFGKESGFGVLKTAQLRYEGQWKIGKQHGKGVLKFEDGRIYEGEFVKGKIKGHGSVTWPSGKSIIGYWLEGEIVGKSEIFYVDKESITKIMDDEESWEWVHED